MEDAEVDDAYARLEQALDNGASEATIRELLDGVKQETEYDLAKGEQLLIFNAMEREPEVFQLVLDAMCKEVIRPANPAERCALYHALKEDYKEAVMAVVDRMNRETFELDHWPLQALFDGDLLHDEEVVDAVIDLLPSTVFKPGPDGQDALEHALRSRYHNREIAVRICLKHATMEEWLEGQHRFRYVSVAAAFSDFEMMRRMHELVPLLADGSGRRGEVADYAHAIGCAARNYSTTDGVSPFFEYLVEQGGSEALDQCDSGCLILLARVEDVEWMLTRAPHHLEAACKEAACLYVLLRNSDTSQYLTQKMVELVDRKVIVDLMRQRTFSPEERELRRISGWRWLLETLHKGVPECMDGLRWPWLMEAIHERAYDDVQYMLEICTREHLVMRDEEGDTAFDVAARDADFPRGLLDRLRVVTKGAQG